MCFGSERRFVVRWRVAQGLSHLEIFSYRKFWAIFASRNRYFRENSRWVPLNNYKLTVPKPHTEFYKRSLSNSGNVLWKSLTLEVRQLTSLYVFKGKLKNLNLEICNIFTWPPQCKASFIIINLVPERNTTYK